MKVAIVHEWFTAYAGSERVVEQMLRIFPDADLFALVDFLPDPEREFLGGRPVRTSFVQRLPRAAKSFRRYLPLMPIAVEQFDLSGYDVVLSSSHAVAKGVIAGPDQIHVSYVHTPIRYAWDLQHEYLRQSGLRRGLSGVMARAVLHYLRVWDHAAAARADRLVANSRYIARRIRKTYRRAADVVYPPVDVDAFRVGGSRDDFYLAASRLVPYKRTDVLVEAFSALPGRRLVVIGDGPDMEKLKAKAGPNVELLGYQPAPVLRDYMARARAYLFAAEEDFGIAPVEAMACGTPVIAYGRGGATETVVEGVTGLLFPRRSPDAVAAAVAAFERAEGDFDAAAVRAHAERFRPERFREEFAAVVDRERARHRTRGKTRRAAASHRAAVR